MSLLDAPIWNDPGTWIVLGISLLFLIVALVMHRVITRVLRAPPPDGPDRSASEPLEPK